MDFEAKASAALEKRQELYQKRQAIITNDATPTGETRRQVDALDVEMGELELEAREWLEKAKDAERRALTEAAWVATGGSRAKRATGDGVEWRSIVPTDAEWRALVAEGTPAAGGYAVPAKVADRWVDKLRAQSVFLRAPGLNVVKFDGGTFTVPQLTASTDPAVVGEGNAIPEATATFAGLGLTPLKYAALYRASSEVLEDASIDMEDLIGQTLVRDIATVVDKDSFQGAGGTAALAGLTAAGNSTATNLTTGVTAVRWDDVIDAVGTIMGTGGMPTVVWASVDMWKGLVKARENGSTGGYLAGSVTDDPARAALGLPLLPSASLPVRTVIVADATRIFVGVRRDVRLARSEQWKFDSDSIGFRATYRIAGVKVAEATSVQRIVASAT